MNNDLATRLANLKAYRTPFVEVNLPADVDSNGELVFENFKLAYDFNAIIAVKNQSDKSLLDPDSTWLVMEKDPELLRTVVWAGLLLYQPEMTPMQVHFMLQAGNVISIMKSVAEAWMKSSAKSKRNPTPEPSTEPAATLTPANQ